MNKYKALPFSLIFSQNNINNYESINYKINKRILNSKNVFFIGLRGCF